MWISSFLIIFFLWSIYLIIGLLYLRLVIKDLLLRSFGIRVILILLRDSVYLVISLSVLIVIKSSIHRLIRNRCSQNWIIVKISFIFPYNCAHVINMIHFLFKKIPRAIMRLHSETNLIFVFSIFINCFPHWLINLILISTILWIVRYYTDVMRIAQWFRFDLTHAISDQGSSINWVTFERIVISWAMISVYVDLSIMCFQV